MSNREQLLLNQLGDSSLEVEPYGGLAGSAPAKCWAQPLRVVLCGGRTHRRPLSSAPLTCDRTKGFSETMCRGNGQSFWNSFFRIANKMESLSSILL